MELKEQLISTLTAPASGLVSPRCELDDSSSGKVSGFIVSPTFDGMEQIDRQHLLWEYLDRALSPEQLLNIVILVTLTPAEAERD